MEGESEMKQSTLGVIIGNRDFFPDALVIEARQEILLTLAEIGVKPILPAVEETELGGVETFADAQKCAALFKRHLDEIDGLLIVLPNFGDEKGILDTVRLSGLNVPILVQAYPDDLDALHVAKRRDAYCGKISACNNLRQRGVPFSLTTRHVVKPSDQSFRHDLVQFLSVCQVVKGVRSARIGAIGARPGAFNTVRYSEKILERQGISVTTIDLSDILAAAEKLEDESAPVKKKVSALTEYADASSVPSKHLAQMARLGMAIESFMKENALDATAIQCWTSIQENFGCNACTLMSMMSEKLLPSACEVDVTGVLTMYALQLASQSPAALVDWNNNYGDDEDRCVLFHCGNWAKSLVESPKISTAPILGSVVGEENTYGAMEGRSPASPLTFARLTTDDAVGEIKAYVGEGHLTDDPLNTFGNRAVARIPNLRKLMHHICCNGFEHHVAMTASKTASILAEAFENYLGWPTYYHGCDDDRSRT